jgi:heme/copper-type cytochrome/quinol oxidase subunit 3
LLLFFGPFFHLSVDPSVFIGAIWPPEGVVPLNPFQIPLLNTYILIFSGATITYTHYALTSGNIYPTCNGFFLTILLGLFFTALQLYEYRVAPFSIADGVYGSTFYMITGLHGAHVLVGTLFIMVGFLRTLFGHFTTEHHLGFEFAVWYWHFVDVVWLFVYSFIYIWGSK